MSITAWFWQLSFLTQVVLVYMALVNIIAFFYYGFDKIKANFGSWRTPEKRLWLLAVLGGTVGSLVGMYFFHHKTKKHSFQAVLILIILLQAALIAFLLS